jgi:hypothetical protein
MSDSTDLFVRVLSGNVTVESTRLNDKGGSVTAILKKPLSVAFDHSGGLAIGARLKFSDRSAVVLLPELDDGSHFEVSQVGLDRFVIDLVDTKLERTDGLTASFLKIITEQFKKDQRPVVTGAEATKELEDILGLVHNRGE